MRSLVSLLLLACLGVPLGAVDSRLLDHPRAKRDLTPGDVGEIVAALYPDLDRMIRRDEFDYLQGRVTTIAGRTVHVAIGAGLDIRPFIDARFVIFRESTYKAVGRIARVTRDGFDLELDEDATRPVEPGDQIQNKELPK